MTVVTGAAVSINAAPVSGTLSVEVEQIDVTVAVKTAPDPRWEHVDQQGHYHAWTHDGQLPTLTAKDEHHDCTGEHFMGIGDTDGCEGYDVTVYMCTICGEKMEPATVSRPGKPEFIPGLTHWSVEVEVDQRLPDLGDRVSVRVDGRSETLFGVGVVADSSIGVEGGGMRSAWTRIIGVSPLGRRVAQREEIGTRPELEARDDPA
jgi:hypothetical protein